MNILKVFILIILVIVLFIIVHYKTRRIWDGYDTKYPKPRILHMVLYSRGPEYDDMYRVTREYYKKFDNVTTIYYVFTEDERGEPYISEDILYIPGKETYIPGVLDKTLETFRYVYKNYKYKYHYYVRSNISTIVNFSILSFALQNRSFDYGGSQILRIDKKYRDHQAGIDNDRYEGTEYISGTCIIFSEKVFKRLSETTDKADRGVIDDVAIGKWVKEQFPDISLFDINVNGYHFVNLTGIENIEPYIKDVICYRNKSYDRKKDVEKMREIIKLL